MKKTVAIMCAGGPVPGINTVIGTVAKAFLKGGCRVLGIHHGYKGSFSDDLPTKDLIFTMPAGFSAAGGQP